MNIINYNFKSTINSEEVLQNVLVEMPSLHEKNY